VSDSAVASGAGARASGGSRGIEAVWLDVLQRITSRAAHEVKGALNGASVNLEVVRSRAESPTRSAAVDGGAAAGGAGIARYANAAATQLDAVIAMSDALLALARAARESTPGGPQGEDVAVMLRRMVVLIAPALRIDDGTLLVVEPLGAVHTGTAPTLVVRALLGAVLLAATERWHHTRCIMDGVANRVVVERHDATLADEPVTVEQEILDAAADAGIQVRMDGSAISMTFPGGTSPLGTGLAS
jgi:hypothetical protein